MELTPSASTCAALFLQMANAEGDEAEKDQRMVGHKE